MKFQPSSNRSIAVYIVLSVAAIVFVVLNKILPDTKAIGFLTRISLLAVAVMVIFGSKNMLGKGIGIAAALYYLGNLIVFVLNNSMHPWAIILLFIADVLFIVSMIKSLGGSDKNLVDRIGDLVICLGLLGVIVASSVFVNPAVRVSSAVLAGIFLLYSIYRTKEASNFVILLQMVVIIVASFFKS